MIYDRVRIFVLDWEVERVSGEILMNKVVVFQAQEEEYGIPIQNVVSIEKMGSLTAVPNMPTYMNGVSTIRGQVTPIFDSNEALYEKKSDITDKTRMIIVQVDDFAFGLIVDDAKEIMDVPVESIQQLNLTTYMQNSYLMGIANINNRLVTIISPSKLVHSLEDIIEVKSQIQ
jgi:purine-binding chemotaxis protein CheW